MDKTAAEIIDELGGPTKVARLCETTPQNVWHWKHGNKGSKPRIPDGYLMYLKVRPEVFDSTTNEGD
jgi:Putative antitoxin of bacterial toxin-antitoxin system, YdaS/YdaT